MAFDSDRLRRMMRVANDDELRTLVNQGRGEVKIAAQQELAERGGNSPVQFAANTPSSTTAPTRSVPINAPYLSDGQMTGGAGVSPVSPSVIPPVPAEVLPPVPPPAPTPLAFDPNSTVAPLGPAGERFTDNRGPQIGMGGERPYLAGSSGNDTLVAKDNGFDPWDMMLEGGLGMMAAASRPGATGLGALGEGALYALRSAEDRRDREAKNRPYEILTDEQEAELGLDTAGVYQRSPQGQISTLSDAKVDRPAVVQEYLYAKESGFTGTFPEYVEWKARATAAPRDTSKAPEVRNLYDEQGRIQPHQWDAAAGKWVPLGGAKAADEGFGLEVGPDGTVRFTAGGGGGTTKPTTTQLEKNTIAAMDQLSRLRGVEESFRPEFLTFQGKGENWLRDIKDRAGVGLTPEEEQQLSAFETFRADAFNNLNRTLQELSGAAVTPQEFDRIQSELPSPLNDGPTAFKAKLDRATLRLKAGILRYQVARELGLGFSDLDVSVANVSTPEAFAATADKLGARLEERYRSMLPPGTPDEQIEKMVAAKLIEMMGAAPAQGEP